MNIMHIVFAVTELGAGTVDMKIFTFHNVLFRSRRSLCDSLDMSRKRDPLVLPQFEGVRKDLDYLFIDQRDFGFLMTSI
jgi:hypothetical protein